MTEKLKIYLAGYTGETEYREIVHYDYEQDFNIIDPMSDGSRPLPKIPSLDKYLIMKSDVVVAYIVKPSFGTSMEICFAYDNNKLVFVIDPTEQIRKDIWVSFHTHRFFDSIESCFTTLKEFDGKNFVTNKFKIL